MHDSKYRDMYETNKLHFQCLQNQGSSQSHHSNQRPGPEFTEALQPPSFMNWWVLWIWFWAHNQDSEIQTVVPKSQSTNSTVHHLPSIMIFPPSSTTLCDEIFRMDTPISSDVFCHDDIVILLQSHLQITTHKLVGHWPKILNWLVPQKTWFQQHLNTPLVLLMACLIELRKPDFGNPTGPQPLYV